MSTGSIVVWLLMGMILGGRAFPEDGEKTEYDLPPEQDDVYYDKEEEYDDYGTNDDYGISGEQPELDYQYPDDYDQTRDEPYQEDGISRRKREVSATQVTNGGISRYLQEILENQPPKQQQITVSKTLKQSATGTDLSHGIYRPYQQIPFHTTATAKRTLVATNPMDLTTGSENFANVIALLKMMSDKSSAGSQSGNFAITGTGGGGVSSSTSVSDISNGLTIPDKSSGRIKIFPTNANFWQSFQSSQGGVSQTVNKNAFSQNYLNAWGGKQGLAAILQNLFSIKGSSPEKQNMNTIPVAKLITIIKTSKGIPWHHILQKIQHQETSRPNSLLPVIMQQINQEKKRQGRLIKKMQYFKTLLAANKCATT